MEKEVKSDVIKATQNSLGKFIKKPPMSEKLLKKPPFRFLHDIVTSVIRSTGFFSGLFDEDELISDNVKDRDSKMLFLNKVISVLVTTTGKSLTVKSSKIVAGQEPEKTNELLQLLAEALDKKLSSEEAVKKFKASSSTKEPENRDQIKPSKKAKDESKHKDTEKSDRKKESAKSQKDKSKTTDKVRSVRSVQKDSSKKEPLQKVSKAHETRQKPEKQKNRPDVKPNDSVSKENINVSTVEDIAKSDIASSEDLNRDLETDNLNRSYTIVGGLEENESTHSQDLPKNIQEPIKSEHDMNTDTTDSLLENTPFYKSIDELQTKIEEEQNIKLSNGPDSSILITDDNPVMTSRINSIEEANRVPIKATTRPQTVRPSSSRPGAPRLKEKNEHVLAPVDNTLLAKVNIISENTPIEEDDDSTTVVFVGDSQNDTDNIDPIKITSKHHGHLVNQILESGKEFGASGKTEIEWELQMDNTRESCNQEIENLRLNIQALSRVANPLGKLLDHVQEDVEVMRQELQNWRQLHEEASKELTKQKVANEESLQPLVTKIKQLDLDVYEKRDKITDLKVAINKNTSRINKLLLGGVMIQ